ncbi:MAG: hypothetical protein JW941_09730 [Candidatus Coatesbacteria bacterium]|nr:hypothetical protein [Candidatus Coatesbacteria bacterium]
MYHAFEKVSDSVYHLFWSNIGLGHFLLDASIVFLSVLGIGLAVSPGAGRRGRGIASVIQVAGRAFAAIWWGLLTLCLLFAAMDLSRLQTGFGSKARWMTVLIAAGTLSLLVGVALLRTLGSRQLRHIGAVSLILRAFGVVVIACSGVVLSVTDIPPQTALGWLVSMLCVLGIPAGIGMLLPYRGPKPQEVHMQEGETSGPRYFKRWDFAFLVPVVFLLFNVPSVPTVSISMAMGESDLVPIFQALMLAICLLNRVSLKDLTEHPRSIFANVFYAFLIGQIAYLFYPTNFFLTLSAAILIYSVLGLKVGDRPDIDSRPWWRKARTWVALAAVTVLLRELYVSLYFLWHAAKIPAYTTHHGIWKSILMLAIMTAIGFVGIWVILRIYRKRDVRRSIRIFIPVLMLLMCGLAAYSQSAGGYGFAVMGPFGIGVSITLALFLVVLRFKKPALMVGLLLRSKPIRVAIYGLLISLAIVNRGIVSLPSSVGGYTYYTPAGLTDSDGRALRVLPPESIPASEFMRRSTFGDSSDKANDVIYAWAGIIPYPAPFPKMRRTTFAPRILGRQSQAFAGAARIWHATDAEVRLDILYSRRTSNFNLSEHIDMQLRPQRFRDSASTHIKALRAKDSWAEFVGKPCAILQLNGPWREWNQGIDGVVETAIFSLLDPPSQIGQTLFWKVEEFPGAEIY